MGLGQGFVVVAELAEGPGGIQMVGGAAFGLGDGLGGDGAGGGEGGRRVVQGEQAA